MVMVGERLYQEWRKSFPGWAITETWISWKDFEDSQAVTPQNALCFQQYKDNGIKKSMSLLVVNKL
jgi:hypothetical protein